MLNEAKTSRPRPKIMKKVPINNIIPEFYTIFARKMPDYIIRQWDRGQAEAKTSRPRLKLRGHFGLEDLTSLTVMHSVSNHMHHSVVTDI